MISKELRRIIFQKYNIEESSINRPIHYKIPENIGKNTYFIFNKLKEELLNKNICNNNKTLYSINKENNIKKIKNNIQRNKIEIEFNKTYNKINHKIEYKPNKHITPIRKLETISLLRKEKIKDDLINMKNFYHSIFKKKYFRNKDNYFIEKHYTWSKILLEQKKIKKYKNRYKIKYIDILPNFHKKIFENHKYKRDGTIPKIIKLNIQNKFNKNKNIDKIFKDRICLTDDNKKNI